MPRVSDRVIFVFAIIIPFIVVFGAGATLDKWQKTPASNNDQLLYQINSQTGMIDPFPERGCEDLVQNIRSAYYQNSGEYRCYDGHGLKQGGSPNVQCAELVYSITYIIGSAVLNQGACVDFDTGEAICYTGDQNGYILGFGLGFSAGLRVSCPTSIENVVENFYLECTPSINVLINVWPLYCSRTNEYHRQENVNGLEVHVDFFDDDGGDDDGGGDDGGGDDGDDYVDDDYYKNGVNGYTVTFSTAGPKIEISAFTWVTGRNIGLHRTFIELGPEGVKPTYLDPSTIYSWMVPNFMMASLCCAFILGVLILIGQEAGCWEGLMVTLKRSCAALIIVFTSCLQGFMVALERGCAALVIVFTCCLQALPKAYEDCANRRRVYIKACEEEEEQQNAARKQEEERKRKEGELAIKLESASKLGMSVELYDSFNSLIFRVQSLRAQTRHAEIQALIAAALDAKNNDIIKSLVVERTTITMKLPSKFEDKTTLIASVKVFLLGLNSYYKSLTEKDDFNFDLAEKNNESGRLFETLLSYLNENEAGLVENLDVFLRQYNCITPLKASALTKVSIKDDSSFAIDVVDETSAGLGISKKLLKTYSAVMDSFEVLRDQPAAIKLDEFIAKATADQNTKLLFDLKQRKKLLCVGEDRVLPSILLVELESLIVACDSEYRELTKMDSFDLVYASRCTNTIKYLSDLMEITKNGGCRELEDALRLRNRVASSELDLHGLEVESRSFVSKVEQDIIVETVDTLGFPMEFVTRYTSVMNELEILRDQSSADQLQIQIDKARNDRNNMALKSLMLARKSLKLSDIRTSFQDMNSKIGALLRDMDRYYDQFTENDSFDFEIAEKCSNTTKFLRAAFKSLTSQSELEVFLLRRGASDVQDFSYPPHVRQILWSAIKPLYHPNRKAYSIEQMYVGSGAHADVFRMTFIDKTGERDVAVKVFHQRNGFSEDYLAAKLSALEEADVLVSVIEKLMDTETVTSLYGVASGSLTSELSSVFQLRDGVERVAIIMRYEEGGSIYSLLHPEPPAVKMKISLEKKFYILRCIADGISSLHSIGCVHDDIKPQNLLLRDLHTCFVRVADFGISRIVNDRDVLQGTTKGSVTTTLKGTIEYCAPEKLKNPSDPSSVMYSGSQKTDIYSFGIVMWEILAEKKPFEDVKTESALLLKVHDTSPNGRPLLSELQADTPPAAISLIQDCWNHDRKKRPTSITIYATLNQTLNILQRGTYDIFFSHPWVNKRLLEHVFRMLKKLGYRVWYDQIDMGNDLDKSMRDGIQKSKIVLACLDKNYQGSKNCMFELRETKRLCPEKQVISLICGNMYDGSWAVSEEIKETCRLVGRNALMYADISRFSAMPIFDKTCDDDIPANVISDLNQELSSLLKMFVAIGLQPSFDPSVNL